MKRIFYLLIILIIFFSLLLIIIPLFSNSEVIILNTQESAPLIIGGKQYREYTIDDAEAIQHVLFYLDPHDQDKMNSLENIEILTNLNRLIIEGKNLDSVDFNPILTLVNLERLRIEGNISIPINLTNLEKLTSITIKYSTLETLEGLGAPNLKRLEIEMETFDSLAPLSNLTELERLDVYARRIGSRTSIGNIKNVPKLESLRLGTRGELDLNGIENIVNIIELRLDGTETILINPNSISKLQNLEVLILSLPDENPSIEYLGNLNKLRSLFIDSSYLFKRPPVFPYQALDVSPLRNNQNLFQLDIRGFIVRNISSLNNLNLEHNTIRLYDSRLFNENDVSVHYLAYVPKE